MKKTKQIRIRVTEHQFDRLIQVLVQNKIDTKSEFVRKAIIERIDKIEKKNQSKVHPDMANIEYLEEIYYDYWEMFDYPENITDAELNLAKDMMNEMKLDFEEERMVSFRVTSSFMVAFIINIKRLIDNRISAENFCDGIEGRFESKK
jgi:hypothetical protein